MAAPKLDSPFVQLHVHTEHSILDGACRIERKTADEHGVKRTSWPLVERAIELGMPAVAITDHGTMSGTLKLQNACLAASNAAGLDVPVKPLIGMEAYIVDDRTVKDPKNWYHHITLLAENEEGYQNLCRLSSIGAQTGFYHKPRLDWALAREHNSGIIALTGCMAGHFMHAIIDEDKVHGSDDRARLHHARDEAMKIVETFGKENVYGELQNVGVSIPGRGNQATWNADAMTIFQDLGIMEAGTADTHYLRANSPAGIPGDEEFHDALLCVQTKKTLAAENRMRFLPQRYHFRSAREMAETLGMYPNALSNTRLIAQRVSPEWPAKPLIRTGRGFELLPKYDVPEEFQAPPIPDDINVEPALWRRQQFLWHLVLEGLAKRFGDPIPAEAMDRAKMEHRVMCNLGVCDYMLLMWDVINYAHSIGVSTGPGRGSGAGSIILYALGVTDLDPIEHDLLFERFMNPERVSMPDIDTDFSVRGRDPVIKYIMNKWNAAQLITFGRIGAKAAFRSSARVEGPEYQGLGNALAKGVSMRGQVPKTLVESLAESVELQQAIAADPMAPKIVERAQWFEGLLSNEGVHASAVMISPVPVHDVVPVQIALGKENSGTIISAFDMKDAEAVGLLKLDILGLKNLDVIDECVEMVRRRPGQENLDISKIPLDDPATYTMLRRGDSIGTFQYESDGMQGALRDIGVTNFADLVAVVALYRPGAMDQISVYAAGKRDPSTVQIPDERMRPIIEVTKGVIVYQEQAMQISRALAGFTGAEADNLRKAIGKKDREKMAKIEPGFREGCKRNKVAQAVIDWVWATFEKSADYSFNKSHAACYALIGYRTAFLKAHFPVEYMCATISWVMNTKDKVPFYLYEAKRMGFTILPPDINSSFPRFTPEGATGMRFGLQAIKGAGSHVIEELVAERERNGIYHDLWDYCRRVSAGTKKDTEALIMAGAFDSTGESRKGLLSVVDSASSRARNIRKKKEAGQDSLFESLESAEDAFGAMQFEAPPVVPKEEFPAMERFKMERAAAGLYVSGHPLDDDIEAWERVRHFGLGELGPQHITPKKDKNAQGITVAGIVTSKTVTYTRKNERMCRLVLEDLTGGKEITIFPKTLARIPEPQDGGRYWVRVKVEEDDRGFVPLGEAEQVLNEDGEMVDAEPAVKRLNLLAQDLGEFDPSKIEVPAAYEIRVQRWMVNQELVSRLAAILSEHPGDKPAQLAIVQRGEVMDRWDFPASVKPSIELTQAISQATQRDPASA